MGRKKIVSDRPAPEENSNEDLVSRLRSLSKRLTLKEIVEQLKSTKIEDLTDLSEPTLSRWQSGRENVKLPERAELAIRLLESSAGAKHRRTLKYGVVANPASLPLTFISSLHKELETVRPAGYPALGESIAPLQPAMHSGDTKRAEGLRLGLQVELVRVAQEKTDTRDILNNLLSNELQLGIVPEATYLDLMAEADRREVLPVCRIASSPTIVLRSRRDKHPTSGTVYVVHQDLPNSREHAMRWRSALKYAATKSQASTSTMVAPLEVTLIEIKTEKQLLQVVPLDSDEVPHVYVFGPTNFLNAAKHLAMAATRRKKRSEWRIDDDEEIEKTDWYLYANRSVTGDPPTMAVILNALWNDKESKKMDAVKAWFDKQGEEVIKRETGLPKDGFINVINPYVYPCDRVSPEVLMGIIKSYLRSGSP